MSFGLVTQAVRELEVATEGVRELSGRYGGIDSRTHGRADLAGLSLREIHSDWRERIESGTAQAGLPVEFSAPVTDHAASDDAGTGTLGEEPEPFWRDHMGAGVNAIRTQTLIRAADVVVVRFGDKYRQWNAAFDAGFAAALGKPIVTLHDGELDHALKEVDRAAQATARTAEQVVDVLRYVIDGKLPRLRGGRRMSGEDEQSADRAPLRGVRPSATAPR